MDTKFNLSEVLILGNPPSKVFSLIKVLLNIFNYEIKYFIASTLPVIVLPMNEKLFLDIIKILKIDSNLKFDYFIELIGVNNKFTKPLNKEYIPRSWILTNKKIYFDNEINYILRSTRYNCDICIKVLLPDGNIWTSISSLFKGALWAEREVWDLCGIPLKNHKDLRRILTDYGFKDHPLKKDFPLSGFIELRYDENKKRILSEPVTLSQDFRIFEHAYTWIK